MRLAEYLKQHELSASAFAEIIGVTGSTVWRYAEGTRIPHRDIMTRIVEATGGAVMPQDFFALAGAEGEAA